LILLERNIGRHLDLHSGPHIVCCENIGVMIERTLPAVFFIMTGWPSAEIPFMPFLWPVQVFLLLDNIREGLTSPLDFFLSLQCQHALTDRLSSSSIRNLATVDASTDRCNPDAHPSLALRTLPPSSLFAMLRSRIRKMVQMTSCCKPALPKKRPLVAMLAI
jgi:hypothetical protein